MKKNLNIFISYRRVDSMNFAGRLHDKLVSEYEMVFFDTEDGIGAGEKFLNVIVKSIEEADVFLMVVGKESEKEFRAREGKDDYVLKEIVQAQKSSCMVIPVLVNGVDTIKYLPKEIEFIEELSFYRFAHDRFSLNIEGLKQEIDKCRPMLKEQIEHPLVNNLLDELEREKVMVLFSQEFTNIDSYYQAIKKSLKIKFSKNFYKISIPSYKSEKKYFASIAKSCGITDKIKELQDWKDAMEEKLENDDEIVLFVTDLEDGNETYNRKFATTIRNLHNEYSNLFVLFIGHKKLASLVFQQGELSPLRSVGSRKFFPSENVTIKDEDIVFEFQVAKQKEYLCELLSKEKVAHFTEWSADELINHLFWKNLLVRQEKHLVWRSEEIKRLGREILRC